jgi:DNA-binding winged helix-turn-helix (wHTH) protein/TolB-like protein
LPSEPRDSKGSRQRQPLESHPLSAFCESSKLALPDNKSSLGRSGVRSASNRHEDGYTLDVIPGRESVYTAYSHPSIVPSPSIDGIRSCDNGVADYMDSRRFRFGLYEFDAAALELHREGALVRLQLQPAQALACLVERADQVVSRDDLRRAVWGDEVFVDFERGLNFCISQIRFALKDNSADPVYIRTVPKSGYQFIAPVQHLPVPAPGLSTKEAAPHSPFSARMATLAFALIALAVLASLAAYRFRAVRSTTQPPILAVLRFDNETGDPDIKSFSDALTDNVVEQLTSQSGGRYRVIGNAQIVRLPREQRDLNAIASSLHAGYVVLGQVQSNGAQVRILAHLIRLSDQTHIRVVRLDRPVTDRLALEYEAAHKIAAEFSAQLSTDPDRAASYSSASN